jgi:methanethiol S-methyltransferase
MLEQHTLMIALAAVSWCVLHSFLITTRIDNLSARLLGRHAPWQRILYNLFSLITLALFYLYVRSHPSDLIWTWRDAGQILRIAGLAAGTWLMLAGIRAYDNRAFLGLSHIPSSIPGAANGPAPLSRHGILGRVRHPYYSGGILWLVFYADVTAHGLLWRGIFVAYMFVGTWLEERKLVALYGDTYRLYQRDVPAFIPRLKRSKTRESI